MCTTRTQHNLCRHVPFATTMTLLVALQALKIA
jgi:hypothetical protein